jgi:hypothetical protein
LCRIVSHNAGAAKAKQQMKENKEQADWLLHNIIPQHVSEQLKTTSKFSKNHKDVITPDVTSPKLYPILRMKSKLNILSLNRPTTACISIQKSIIANKWAYGCLF